MCRNHLDKAALVPNRIVRTLIEESDIHCPSTAIDDDQNVEFCDWIGCIANAETHYKECIFVDTPCPHEGCKVAIARKDVSKHVVECPCRKVCCLWCGQYQMSIDLDTHNSSCLKRPIACPNGCTDVQGNPIEIPLEEITNHLDVCSLELVPCAFVSIGCSVKLARKDVVAHENKAEAHIQCHPFILKALQTSKDEIFKLKKLVSFHDKAFEAMRSIRRRRNEMFNFHK